MRVILWSFRARAGRESEFETAYGPEGVWAQLFKRHPGYLGSELMRASDGRYLVLDRWTDEGAYAAFRQRYANDYDALDAHCLALTEEETPLGSVEV